jgi:competence protein ComEC
MFKFFFWLLVILLIVFRFFYLRPNFIDGSRIRISSERIRSEPVRFEKSQRITILGLKAYLPLYPEINYGDMVTVEGRVNLKKKTLDEAKLIKLEKGNSFYKLRERLILFYQKYLPEPHSSLVAGMVLGSKASLPYDFWQNLKKTGTAHVVVASGMNVSLIAGFLASFFIIFLKRRYALLLSLLGIWFYAFLCGFEAPIIRASIMGSLSFIAVIFGRMNLALRALFISFFLMLIFNPYFIFDVGFILSFAATLSLILFQKKVDNFLKFIPSFLREGFSTSLAAQILVAPILYFTFGYFSIYSPLINGLVLWTVPYITILGMLSGIFSLFIPFLGRFLLLLSYPLTFWFVGLVNLLGRI